MVPEHTGDELCVVGTLIDKLPVWVYNTDINVVPVNSEENLNRYADTISKMICYKKGTTGYLIAKRLQTILSIRNNDIQTVDFGEDFLQQIDHRTVIVTSDVLRIVHGGLDNKKVIFSYPRRSPSDIAPFLFTAILTLKREVIDSNLWAVLAILAGLKNAIELLKQPNVSDEHIQILVNRFNQRLIDIGITDTDLHHSLVRDTLRYVFHTANIYPDNFKPQRQAWENAKEQWETIMGKMHASIDEYSDPIPSLLIKSGWKRNAELRALITEGIPSIESVIKNPVLKWHHKAAGIGSIVILLISIYQLALSITYLWTAAQTPFSVNFPGFILESCSFLWLVYATYSLNKCLSKLDITRIGELFAQGIIAAVLAFATGISMIK